MSICFTEAEITEVARKIELPEAYVITGDRFLTCMDGSVKEQTMIKYICTTDYQGVDFAVGTVGTVERWKEIVYNWSASDAYDDDHITELESLQGVSVIKRIAEVWALEIVEYDENNAEHKKLAEKRGN